jgi:hypothetical protein
MPASAAQAVIVSARGVAQTQSISSAPLNIQTVERVELQSRSIKAAGYDPERALLEVEFHSGAMYRYEGVPAGVYQELLAAESHGRYFNQNIRNRYLTVKLALGSTRS